MTSDISSSETPDEPVWGAPAPRRGWKIGHTLAAVGVAAVIAALGGAAIYTATTDGPNQMDLGIHGRGPSGMGPDAIHGEFVVRNDNGGYTTMLTQVGVLTAASDTSITAKSADGFTQTYTIAPDSGAAKTQLAVNDTVTIRGTRANGTATATTVTEGSETGHDTGPPHR